MTQHVLPRLSFVNHRFSDIFVNFRSLLGAGTIQAQERLISLHVFMLLDQLSGDRQSRRRTCVLHIVRRSFMQERLCPPTNSKRTCSMYTALAD